MTGTARRSKTIDRMNATTGALVKTFG